MIKFHLLFNSLSDILNSIGILLISGVVLYGIIELVKYILTQCKVKWEGKWYITLIPLWCLIIGFIESIIITRNFIDGLLNGAIIAVLAVYLRNIIEMILKLFHKV